MRKNERRFLVENVYFCTLKRMVSKKIEQLNAIVGDAEPVQVIEDEVVFLDNLRELVTLSSTSPVKMDYNAVILCRRGKIMLEIGGNSQVRLEKGQLMLVPAQKLLQPMMVSTDIDAVALLISNRVLKAALGPQADIWNHAMYISETYVITGDQWTRLLQDSVNSIFKDKDLKLRNEFLYAFLRILFLVICEELLRTEGDWTEEDTSNDREKRLFKRFLELLSSEPYKRQQVNYYAEKLCVTPKYLSTVCHKASGQSPIHWITDSVMGECYELLRNSTLSVKEISDRLGFPNSSFFGQFFRRQAGMTPLEYRKGGKR